LSRPRSDESIETIAGRLAPIIRKKIDYGEALRLSRANLAIRIIDAVEEACQRDGIELTDADGRNVVTILTNLILNEAKRVVQGGSVPAAAGAGTSDWSIIEKTKQRIQPILLDRIDVSKAVALPPEELAKQISEVVSEILAEEKLQLNSSEQRDLVTALLNDLLGLGPLEVLLADETVSDIMVNGPKQVYVERKGKLQITDVAFRDNAHVMSICTRHRQPRRAPGRRNVAAVRRPAARRLARQHHHPAAGPRRAVHLHPQVRQAQDHPRRHGAAGQSVAGDGDGVEDRRPLSAEYPDLRRHRLRQDHASQCAVAHDRPRRAHRHHRGRRRTAAATAARGAA
jgi:hypothetical protein